MELVYNISGDLSLFTDIIVIASGLIVIASVAKQSTSKKLCTKNHFYVILSALIKTRGNK